MSQTLNTAVLSNAAQAEVRAAGRELAAQALSCERALPVSDSFGALIAAAEIDCGGADLITELETSEDPGIAVMIRWVTVSGDFGRRPFRAAEWREAKSFARRLRNCVDVYHSSTELR